MTVLLDRETAHGSAISILERELDRLLEVTAFLRARACLPRPSSRFVCAAEEGVKKIREGISVAEEFPHFLFSHRTVTARPSGIRPPATTERSTTERRTAGIAR